MAIKKCKYCGEFADDKAVICINCGTNQKTGKSFKAYNERRRKTFAQKLLILIVLGAFLFGCYYFSKRYRSQISELKSGLVTKITSIAGKQVKKQEEQEEQKNTVPKETVNFPMDIAESKDAEKYIVYVGGHLRTSIRTQPDGSRKSKFYVAVNVRVDPPAGLKEPLRVKIYSGKSSSGEYDLIYDQEAEAKMQVPRTLPSYRRELHLKLPDKLKNAPAHIREKFLEHRKKLYERVKMPEPKPEPPCFCARFDYKNDNFELVPGQDSLYFRAILYDSKGQVIKESTPKRWAIRKPSYSAARQYAPGVAQGYDSRPPSLNGHTIYPYFYGSHRALKFAFLEKDAFEIVSFSIDGVKCPVVFIGTSSQNTYSDRKTKAHKTYYSSSMSLGYPFGGQAKLEFKYKTASGKFKQETFSFYLPPPPPLLRVKADSREDAVTISWDKIGEQIDKSHFSVLPVLELQRNQRSLKSFETSGRNSYFDKEVFRGEPVNYRVSFTKGVYKASLWSSEKGVESYKLAYNGILNPFSERGINITVPSRSEKAHPIRVELLETSLCYENTGIAACKLMDKVLEGVMEEKDMVFYDRRSRDYIIDEKFFALSESLKKQFMIKEADYAVQIRDYSRQDGNGLELWLFKKKIEGTGATKSTVYWRIADITLKADSSEIQSAVKKLIAQIRETLEFTSCPDPRAKNIKPKNIICMPLRPVNQRFVVWNYAAICESLFLSLGEKISDLQILSRDDWDQLFSERIRRFDEGHSVIDNMVREVLLTGRLWRSGNARTYYIQACDAFSGEVLGARVFTGKLNEVSVRLAAWLKELRLSDDLKVDFQISKFHQQIVKTSSLRPWQPRNSLLRNFGPCISNPAKSWSVRKTKGVALRSYNAADNKGREAFYSFVKRQWKDGFRAKAIKLLQDDWKSFKSIKTGTLLGSYYIESKRYQDAIDLFEKDFEKKKSIETGFLLSSYYIKAERYQDALVVYDTMLQMDNCPKQVYDDYNSLKQKAKGVVPKRIVKKEEKKAQKSFDFKFGEVKVSTTTLSDELDYRGVETLVATGKNRKLFRYETSNPEELEKSYFVDRDKIYPEWAPNQPCRTATLVLSIPATVLSKGIHNTAVRKYGVWQKALRLGVDDSFEWSHLFRNWKYLSDPPCEEPNFIWMDENERPIPITAAKKRQMSSICKPRILVFEAGWNSINPFSESLDEVIDYTRLAYFFDNYKNSVPAIDLLYHYSRIRAFFELTKNPSIGFPKFTFASLPARKAYISRIRTGKDMIRYWAQELAEMERVDREIHKNKFNVREFKLYQMLALNYIVRHESNENLTRLYRMLKATPIPVTLNDYSKSPVRTDFLVFMAYKKNRNAVKLLNLMLDHGGSYISEHGRADYAYVLGQAGYTELVERMAPRSGLENTTLRWLPKKILDKVSGTSNYLIFGTRNDSAARQLFLKYNSGEIINQYFGKPPAEAYRDWMMEHYQKTEKLDKRIK